MELGIANGTTGVLEEVIYPGQDLTEIPIFLVRIPSYKGILWDKTRPHIVPIVPLKQIERDAT